jgi:hypothetical protein
MKRGRNLDVLEETMRRLAITMLLTVVMVRCLVATAYAGEPTAKLLGDRQYWSTFAWDDPEKSGLFASVPWTKLASSQFEAFKYAHRMQLDGVPVVLYALRVSPDSPGSGDFDIVYTTFDKKKSAADFSRLLQWCNASYGTSSAQVDNVKRIYKVQTFTTSYTYWVQGATIIRLATGEVIQNGMPVYVGNISYLDARRNRVRSAEKVLSCELDLRRLDRELAGILPEKVVYKFDEADGVVKEFDDTVISDDVVSTDTVLKFSKQSGTMLKEHHIDKSTGEYRFTLFNSSNTARRVPDVEINGTCILTEPARTP